MPPLGKWWSEGDSNPWPLRCERSALPTELPPHIEISRYMITNGMATIKPAISLQTTLKTHHPFCLETIGLNSTLHCLMLTCMKILVVGSGGREHTLAWKLAQDPSNHTIYCAPGNAGTAMVAENLTISADDIEALTAWAKEHRPDLTVIGPEAPLCLGLADALEELGLKVFGPCRAGAQIEGSKLFAKEVMEAAGVPTARSAPFSSSTDAIAALKSFDLPVVIKADGLAAGKGVIIAATHSEAVAAVRSMLDENAFGKAGARILIEEFLDGEEASILALVDGNNAVLLPPSQDHKRAFDGDQGPNTGGMGAYSPAPIVTPEMLPQIHDTVIMPVVRELKKRGINYKGVLYAGLMIGSKGINVLEFNARFGDPETQAVLLRLESELAPLLLACTNGTLNSDLLKISPDSAATVIIASDGYPGDYHKGVPITGLDEAAAAPGVNIFHCGTKLSNGTVCSAGGRVLSVTALGSDLREAVQRAYQAVDKINFKNSFHRRDIAYRAFSHQT